MPVIRNRIRQMLAAAARSVHPEFDTASTNAVEIDIPKTGQHGDYATNLALSLTRVLKRNPREIAKAIVDHIEDPDRVIDRIEIAGPGFINLFIRPAAWQEVLRQIFLDPDHYGRSTVGAGTRVQVEFVSANPTGPLHIGHGRGAATGDVLANLLEAVGYDVEREYYINDAGNQMDTLGRSLYYRYLEVLGEAVTFPDNHYRGEYMIDLAREFCGEFGDIYRSSRLEDVLPVFTSYAGGKILDGIRDDLDVFGVSFNRWYSERTLHENDAVRSTIEELRSRGHVFDEDGATWFRSTAFGDEKDRVVVRANGASTYFAADLAYHKDKYDRGYDMVVDIWGADHHGYVERMLAGVQALGRSRSDLRVILVQLVNLLRAGQPVAMSTRAGEFVTLREVVDEVGKDAARYIFLTRRSDSPLDFDLDVAKTQSNDNPVFYVQYAHARLCSIFEVARERGIDTDGAPDPALLTLPQEIEIIKLLGEFPGIVQISAQNQEPHHIPYYLHELVSLFHSYYNKNRIIGEDRDLTRARLHLAEAIRVVIRNALGMLGVSAPNKM